MICLGPSDEPSLQTQYSTDPFPQLYPQMGETLYRMVHIICVNIKI
jgi:hypothetical protein